MCNEIARRIALGQLRDDWSELKIPLTFPEGLPNLAPEASIRITDPALILRADPATPHAVEGVTRRWSWPGQGGRPVYNYRSEGRALANAADHRSGRCLVVVDAFFEFTDPEPDLLGDTPRKTRKTKWRFVDARPPLGVPAKSCSAGWGLVLHRRGVADRAEAGGGPRGRGVLAPHLRARSRCRSLSPPPGGGAAARAMGRVARRVARRR